VQAWFHPGDDLRRPLEELKILAAAVAVLALVAGVTFGLLRLLIPRPGEARVEAAELSGRLMAFHRTFAVEQIGKLTFVVTCQDSLVRDGRRQPGEVLVIPHDSRLIDANGDIDVVAGGHRRLALEQFLLAGCPRALAEKLRHDLLARAVTLRADGRHLVLDFSAREQRLSLVLSRPGSLPVQLVVAVRGISGTSVVHFVAGLRHRHSRA